MFAPGAPQITGEHLVGPDGKVHFGKRYGAVSVAGLTLEEAKKRIEEHLTYYLVDPKVTVDVHAYNSKKYYIITKGEGTGDNVVTAPITGNETVMDAIAAIGGLHGEANIRIARPAPNGQGTEKVVYVDYEAITKNADTRTNYQLWPGDRLYVEYPGEAKGTTPKEVKQRTIPKLRRTPGGSWQPVEDESDPNLVGKMLLRKKERLERAPQTQPAYSESGVVKLAPEQSERVRYQIGLVIDPKQTLRAMELKKQGPIMVGESSLMLGMLRVLQKNELVRLFEGQNTVAEVGGESSNVLIHLEDSTILAKALQLDEPEDEDKLRSKGGFTLRVVEQLVQTNGGVAFEARAKLSQGQDFRQIDTAIILDEGQSGLASFATENDDAEAGDAYLLITRERVE